MFCTRCGASVTPAAKFCVKCGTALVQLSGASARAKAAKNAFRKHFALTFALALGTGLFWYLQNYEAGDVYSSFLSPAWSLLSLVARISIVIAFTTCRPNWLATSAIASTSSIFLAVLGTGHIAQFPQEWATSLTYIFSIATIVTYVVQVRKWGLTPFATTKNNF